jgi:peptide chain release factor 1
LWQNLPVVLVLLPITHLTFEKEGGKHVVQRISPTERHGRRHTSVVAVSVIPIVDNSYQIKDSDIEIMTQRGHGKGGQHQNKTESAVRMRHKPSGIEVFINGRDQKTNKRVALAILSARIQEKVQSERHNERNNLKRDQISDMGRSDKVRTYNFMEDRVVDHRTNKRCSIREIEKGGFEKLW